MNGGDDGFASLSCKISQKLDNADCFEAIKS